MYSRTHRVLCWFTILEQLLENMVRPVQHALKKYIVIVIKQFTDISLIKIFLPSRTLKPVLPFSMYQLQCLEQSCNEVYEKVLLVSAIAILPVWFLFLRSGKGDENIDDLSLSF